MTQSWCKHSYPPTCPFMHLINRHHDSQQHKKMTRMLPTSSIHTGCSLSWITHFKCSCLLPVPWKSHWLSGRFEARFIQIDKYPLRNIHCKKGQCPEWYCTDMWIVLHAFLKNDLNNLKTNAVWHIMIYTLQYKVFQKEAMYVISVIASKCKWIFSTPSYIVI